MFRDSGPDARLGAFSAPPAAGAGPEWIMSQAPAFLSPPLSSDAAGTGVAGEAGAGAGAGMTMVMTILPVFHAPAEDDGSARPTAAGAATVASLPSAGDLLLCEPKVWERLQLKQQKEPGASGGSWSTVGPGKYCPQRHRIPFNPLIKGSNALHARAWKILPVTSQDIS